MFGLLFLIAAGVGIFAFSGDDSPGAAAEDGDTSMSDADAIADSQWQGTVDEDDILAARDQSIFSFMDGPLNVATGDNDATVLGSVQNDTIITGAGDDYVLGDRGDDTIELGDGDDIAGFLLREDGSISNGGVLGEPGDDTIKGGAGNDQISDLQGSNRIEGNTGDDVITVLDIEPGDAVTPDEVFGGFGSDVITVDSGDTVNSGPGKDSIIVDLFNFEGDGPAPAPVTTTDYSVENDQVILEGPGELLNTPPITDPDDISVEVPVTELISPVTVVELEDGTGTSIRVDGIEVVRLTGVTDFDHADLIIRSAT